mmetsp:Transcript_50076/g.128889  ORF Transcript_50076/g.128889 Transcript_50076/m.128889 type:complete len:295 (-) Transcript_50076:25-909(-)
MVGVVRAISADEKVFIEEGVNANIRQDGRDRYTHRHVSLESGILEQANGSARVKLGGTDVVAAVKAELMVPTEGEKNEGRVKCGVECTSIAGPSFEGRAAEDRNAALASMLEKLVTHEGAIDLRKLCLVEGQHAWLLYIDVQVISVGGNMMDAITLAARGALANAKIPNLRVVQGATEDKKEVELSNDPDDVMGIDVKLVPLSVTLTLVGNHYIVDPTEEEEMSATSTLTVGVNGDGNICAIEKSGVRGMSTDGMSKCLSLAKAVAKATIEQQNDAILRESRSAAPTKKGFLTL